MGYSPVAVLIAMVVIDIMAVIARMIMAKHIFNLSIKAFIWQVIMRVILVTAVALVIPLVLRIYMAENIWRFFVVVVASLLSTSITVLYIGCSSVERKAIIRKAQSFIKRNMMFHTHI